MLPVARRLFIVVMVAMLIFSPIGAVVVGGFSSSPESPQTSSVAASSTPTSETLGSAVATTSSEPTPEPISDNSSENSTAELTCKQLREKHLRELSGAAAEKKEQCIDRRKEQLRDSTTGSGQQATQLTHDTEPSGYDLRSIDFNQTAVGSVDSNDPSNATFRGYYEPVTFSGQAGQLARISMGSRGDTYLFLLGPNGNIIAEDDDGGDGLNSTIDISLPTTGNYTIVATSFSEDDTFDYQLTLTEPVRQDLASISVGGAAYSTVDNADLYNDTYDGYYESVSFDGQAGQELALTASSVGGDDDETTLYLRAPNGTLIAEERGYELAETLTTLPVTGTYEILVGNDYDDSFTEYQLAIAEESHDDASSITVGGAVTSTVDTGDHRASAYGDVEYSENITLDGAPGRELTVSVTSDDQDAYPRITIYRPDGTPLAQNQEGSRSVRLTQSMDGNYTVRVSEYGETFDYTLSATRTIHPDARSIGYNDTVVGAIDTGDPYNSSYRYDGFYEPINFTGNAGQEVSIELRPVSEDGNVDYRLRAPNGTFLARADSYGDHEIEATLPVDGTYTIVTSTYEPTSNEYYLSLRNASHADVRNVSVNSTISSTIEVGDSFVTEYDRRTYYEPLTFTGDAGELLSIGLTTHQESKELELYGPNGTQLFQEYVHDEERLSTRLPENGTYTLFVKADTWNTGDYELLLQGGDPSDLRTLAVGQQRFGTIDTSDPMNTSFEGYHEPVSIEGQDGERLVISMRAGSDFYDSRLYLRAPNGTIVAQNDYASTESVSSQIVHTPDTTGTYTVIAASDTANETGNYSLAIRRPLEFDLQSAAVDGVRTGRIDANDSFSTKYETRYEEVQFDGQAGQQLTLSVHEASDDYFDGRVSVFAPNGSLISSEEYESNSELTLPADGTYTAVIYAESYDEALYNYSLALLPTQHSDATAIGTNGSLRSTVDTGDQMLETTSEGPRYGELISYNGTAGEVIEITLRSRSQDSDAVVGLLAPNGSMIARSSNYRPDLKQRLPVSGTYTIVTTSQSYESATYAYDLGITTASISDADQIGFNQVIRSTVDSNDSFDRTFEGAHERIALDGAVGEEVLVTMNSLDDDGDTAIYLQNSSGTIVAQQEGYESSTLEHVMKQNGTYTVVASNGYDEQAVDYQLAVTSLTTTTVNYTSDVTFSKSTVSTITPEVGEQINVSATLENRGTVDGNETVQVRINGTTVANETVIVPGTSTETVNFPLSFDQTGRYNVSVTTNETSVTHTLNVTESKQAVFNVADLTTPSRTSAGSSISVSATITNTGTDRGTMPVDLIIDGVVRATKNVTLNESARQVIGFTPTLTDEGTAQISVRTANDSASSDVSVALQEFTCGPSTGDPHLITFDGVSYDFQAAGEFVLVREEQRDGSSPLRVQVRQVPVSDSVSVNDAVVTLVDGKRVMIDSNDTVPLQINGTATELAAGEAIAVGDGLVQQQGQTYTIVYPGADGVVNASDEHLDVTLYSDRVDVSVCLAEDRTESVEGLLGTPDGNATNDLQFANGTVLERPISGDVLYGAFRDSWRVTNNTTLFTYENGNSPSTYFLPDFPQSELTVDDLPADLRDEARERAIEAGLEPGTAAFRDAVIDYAVTGDLSYLASARQASTQSITTDLSGPATVSLEPTETAPSDGLVTFNVTIQPNNHPVYGASTLVKFNQSVLNVTEVRAGGLLEQDGADTIVVSNQTDNQNGTIDFGETRTVDTGTTGEGVLFQFTAEVNTSVLSGETPVQLQSVTLANASSGEIPTTVQNASVLPGAPPSVAVELRSTVNNVGAPIRARVTAQSYGASLDQITLRGPSAKALAARSPSGNTTGHSSSV